TGPVVAVWGRLLILVALVGLNLVVARLDKNGFFHRLLSPAPSVIIHNRQYIDRNLRREGVDRDECEMAMREHGFHDVKEVKLGVLESDGSISIVPESSTVHKSRRTVRYVRHN